TESRVPFPLYIGGCVQSSHIPPQSQTVAHGWRPRPKARPPVTAPLPRYQFPFPIREPSTSGHVGVRGASGGVYRPTPPCAKEKLTPASRNLRGWPTRTLSAVSRRVPCWKSGARLRVAPAEGSYR